MVVFCVSYSALLSTTKATIIWIARLALATIERPRYAYARHSGINENHH